MIIMGIIAIFLINYTGPKSYDFFFSSLAGICILVLLLFPTSTILNSVPDSQITHTNTVLEISSAREYTHYISSAIFLACLAIMSLFFFTKSDKPKEDRGQMKRIRNWIYIICGILMVIALLVIFICTILMNKGMLKPEDYNSMNMTFWMETMAVESFGISWLVKGEA